MKLVLVGDGRMGRAVAEAAEARGHQVLALLGQDVLAGASDTALATRLSGANAAIDFTVATQVPATVRAAAEAGVPLVIGTTGWSDRAEDILQPARDAGLGLVHGPNFSVGVHLFLRVVQAAAGLVDRLDDYDVSLHEAHHRHKVDHPSGTAIRVAEALVREIDRKKEWSSSLPAGQAVDPATLYVSSVRAGEIPGTHVVGIEGPDDAVEVRHTARGRGGFASGAVVAAEWIQGRTGVHTFESLLDHILGQPDKGTQHHG